MQAILNSDVYNSNGTCNELMIFAYNSHPSCYVDNGFCSDILLSLTNIICLENVLSISDFKSRLAIQQFLDTIGHCSKNTADSFLNFVQDWLLQPLTDFIRSLLETIQELLGDCNSGIDVIFVLDSSGSVGSNNFQTMKTFVINVISDFSIGPTKTRVGIINFSTDVAEAIPLGSINESSSLNAAINSIPYIGRGTNTHLALNLLRTSGFANSRANEGIPRVAIVLTDGQSNDPEATVLASTLLHQAGINVYAFGIGTGVNVEELTTIASSPLNVFQIASFSPAAFSGILLQLQSTACTTPAQAQISNEIEGNLDVNEVRLLQYPFPNDGMTLKINNTVGQLQVLGSFTIRNPTTLTADFSVNSVNNEGTESIDYFISPQLYANSTSNANQGTSMSPNSNTTSNVYLAVIGLNSTNTFVLDTTTGNTVAIKSGAGLNLPSFTLLTFALLLLFLFF
jgi:uncharacterized protein YegL